MSAAKGAKYIQVILDYGRVFAIRAYRPATVDEDLGRRAAEAARKEKEYNYAGDSAYGWEGPNSVD